MLKGLCGPRLIGSIAASQNCILTFHGSKLASLRCLQPCISGLTAQPFTVLLPPVILFSHLMQSAFASIPHGMRLLLQAAAFVTQVLWIGRR